MKSIFLSLLLLCLPVGLIAAEPSHKVILGVTEWVAVQDLGLELEGKLDTGAVSSSLSAFEIEPFERDGERWVRFRLGLEDDDRRVELPVEQTVRIRRRADDISDDEKDFTRRYVTMMNLCVGGRLARVRVNLADRRHFSTPLLIGVDTLNAWRVLIDPELEFAAGKPACGDLPRSDAN